MMMKFIFLFLLTAAVEFPSSLAQEQEFINLVKELLQGDELNTFQNAYASLPLEIRDKLSKDLLTNPSKLLNMVGPQVQNLLSNFGALAGGGGNKKRGIESNEVDVDEMSMDYNKQGQQNKQSGNQGGKQNGGMDFGPLGSLLGNLISSNPQMLMNVVQGLFQGNGAAGGQGFSFESITSMLTQQFDLDTVINMASAFAGSQLNPVDTKDTQLHSRGEGGSKKPSQPGQGIADILKIQQLTQMWTDFIKSPVGQKVNRVLPRLLKAQSLPDALRLIEKETQFRFDVILKQFQEPIIRKMFVDQLVRPIGQFFKGLKVPSDLKNVISRADDVLNNKMGLGVTMKEYIDPITQHIRDTFQITKESLLDLSPEDIEKIASDILNKEVLEPLTSVYDAYEKARENSICAKFIFCQLNHNFYNENFIRRNVIKTSSIISAFQASAIMKKDAFSGLYESIHIGADGFDCTHGTSNFCLDLMHTTSHNEL